MIMNPSDKDPNDSAKGIGPAESGTFKNSGRGRGGEEAAASPTIVVQQSGDFDDGLSAADIRNRVKTGMAIVWRYWPVGAALGLLLTSGFVWYMMRQPVMYEAVTTVLAKSPLEKMIIEASQNSTGEMGENTLKNHISVMTSRSFVNRLAEAFTPEEKAAILEPYLAEPEVPDVASVIGSTVEAKRERGREFFTITALHQKEDVALLLSDRFVSEYQKVILDEVLAARRNATLYLRQRADELTREIKALEDERREYREKYNLITVEENQGIFTERQKRMNLALADVQMERFRLESSIAAAETDLARTPTPFDNPHLSVFGNNQALRMEVERLRNERETLSAQFGPNHPTMREANRAVESAQALLEAGFRLGYEDLKSKLQLAIAAEQQLNQEINAIFAQSLELDKMAGGFKRLTEEISAKQLAQTDLLRKISREEVNADVPTDTLRIVDAAYLTGKNTSRLLLMIAGGIFLFGGCLVAVPLGLYAITDRVTGSMDFENEFKLGLLGVVPRLGSTPEADRPHIVRDNVDLEHVESFLSLAAQMDISSDVAYPKRVLVTSTVPGEGKSMIASNLASTFTRYGRKTVLVDFDFRRPVQQEIHDVQDDRGFLTWAAADCPMGADLLDPAGPLGLVVLPDGTSLIPTGGVHVQPGRFLVAKATIQLLERLSSEFDVVVVDSPPAGLFQDALILARYCQETVLVVREGRPHIAQIRKVLADLAHMPTRMAGFVLNGFSPRTTHPSVAYRYASYGKYAYGYNGRYRQKSDRKEAALAGEPGSHGKS
ncbi:GNVR domain-containing protein [Opitutales bacterium ASA1]|nr:GNVR domain-containing protein [Opitutales bacterium ASA1]